MKKESPYEFLRREIPWGVEPFPFLKVLRAYACSTFRADFKAGLNVALLAFPQGMAYALIAGLPIEYGIYGSALAAIFGSFFAGSRFIMLGPTNATAVILLGTFASIGMVNSDGMLSSTALDLLPSVLVLSGIILLVASVLRVAGMVQFVSRTVITGYVTAAAILILANQAKNLLGVTFDGPGETAMTAFDVVRLTILHLGDASSSAMYLSACTAIIYFVLRRKFPLLPNVAITLVLVSIGSYLFPGEGSSRGLQSYQIDFSMITLPSADLSTIHSLLGAAAAIALLSALEGISIGKSLAASQGGRVDVNQEAYSLGMANLGCAFFSGMPASGSLTRSTLNVDSGAKTPVSSLIAGTLVLGGAFAFAEHVRYIPLPALATLVVFIGASLISVREIRRVSRATRSDAITFYVTLGCGLFISLQVAVFAGIIVSIGLFLRKVSTPELIEYAFTEEGYLAELSKKKDRPTTEVSIVHVEGELFFAAAELFREQLRRVCEDANLKVLVLKLRNAHHMDATSILALEELLDYMKGRGRHVMICEIRKEILRVFRDSGLLLKLNRKNLFLDTPRNPTLSAAKAIRRARRIIGDQKATVTIFAEELKQRASRREGKESKGLP
ncbi:MAG: SulP family inorganic anion transporter [Opitutales bacterium]